jgi:predicted DNA-binding helix-hairpin-helix protein
LRVQDLAKVGLVVKRAQFFLTVSGRLLAGNSVTADRLRHCLLTGDGRTIGTWQPEFQLFTDEPETGLEVVVA